MNNVNYGHGVALSVQPIVKHLVSPYIYTASTPGLLYEQLLGICSVRCAERGNPFSATAAAEAAAATAAGRHPR